MAQKVNIVLVDDIDGDEATETVTFGLDGVTYEIDLNDDHAGELRNALGTWIGHARKVAGRRGGARRASGSSAASSSGGPSAREIRDWARSNGFEVPERGRIPANVREAFDAAN